MYKIFTFIENVIRFIRIKIKILYWKLKYGKRIKIGKNLHFRKGLIINISKNGYVEIGNNCFFNNNCSINSHDEVIIGNDNIFGENVKIYDHYHIFNDKSINIKYNFKTNKIKIGNKNWISSDVIFLHKSGIKDSNVISAKTIINQKYDSNNIIKNSNNIQIEKIKYNNAE